jgi:transcriptional regulator with XRE-family HTH domain
MTTTGLDLKLKRVAKRVRVTDLADRMGVGHPRVSHIEGAAIVTDTAARKYLTALATFDDVATEAVAS